MRLTPGTSLGPYQIEAPLVAGSTVEVHNASDTRLDRTVVIKALVTITIAVLIGEGLALPVAAQESPLQTATEIEQFLLTADIVDAHPLVTYDAELAMKLELLDERYVAEATDGHLTFDEMQAVLARRDLILQRFDELKARVPSGQ